jgi:hypothetical protein
MVEKNSSATMKKGLVEQTSSRQPAKVSYSNSRTVRRAGIWHMEFVHLSLASCCCRVFSHVGVSTMKPFFSKTPEKIPALINKKERIGARGG